MEEKYDFRFISGPEDRRESQNLYLKLVSNGTLVWEQPVEEIASHFSFDREMLSGAMGEGLNVVRLEPLGGKRDGNHAKHCDLFKKMP